MAEARVQEEGAKKALAHVTSKRWLHRGKWLCLSEVEYVDEDGRKRTWETLERSTHGARVVDAVEIIPVLRRRDKPNTLVCVRQFRPPTGKYFLELPAGLVDENETADQAALRELQEETGYVGSVNACSMSTAFGMAISSIVVVDIDGEDPRNQNPHKLAQEGEHTQLVLLPMHTLLEALPEYHARGDGIDSKIWMLAYATQNAHTLLH